MRRAKKCEKSKPKNLESRINDISRLLIDIGNKHAYFLGAYSEHLFHSAALSYAFLQVLRKHDLSNGINNEYFLGGALLHDIGKDSIVNGYYLLDLARLPRRLRKNELAAIRMHTINGYEMIPGRYRKTEIGEIVLYHHERWDGNGYPFGLKKGKIPRSARILSIADAFNAMMDKSREYKRAKSEREALQELLMNAGKQFDPELAGFFVNHYDEIKALCESFKNKPLARYIYSSPYALLEQLITGST
ncbi:HD domain-containing protein [Candidatus Woesearchaeota archaeon]|nr:HD domain-containing protein [Candidatus Woesearchaeota archaeon]